MSTLMRLGDLWAKHHSGTMRPDDAETNDLFIFGVTDDSRDVRYGYLFCALPGVKENGLAFCAQAAARGAQAIAVCDSRGRTLTKKVPFSDVTIIREIAAAL